MTQLILLVKKDNFTISDNFISDFSGFLSLYTLKCDIVCINDISFDFVSDDFDFLFLSENINFINLSKENQNYNIDATI